MESSSPQSKQPAQPVSLYQMYRKLQDDYNTLQAENNRLKAENNILQNLIESWTNRFSSALESSIKSNKEIELDTDTETDTETEDEATSTSTSAT